MHNRGKRMCVEAILPSGRAETLNCMYFDFNWHKVYNYADDVDAAAARGHGAAHDPLARQHREQSQ